MRILIADDHPLMREALKRLVGELSQEVRVVEATSIDTARAALVEGVEARLIVLELALDGATGLSALEALMAVAGNAPIVVHSTRDDPATARAVLEAGARGFLSKRSPRRVVLEALRLVLFGGTYVPPEALHEIAAPAPAREAAARAPRGGDPLSALGLTPRQMDVLALLVQGNSTKQICRELCLAEGTIKVHTTAILRALDAASRTQAICALTRLGVSLSALAALRSARLARASVGRVGDGSAGTVRLMTGALGAG